MSNSNPVPTHCMVVHAHYPIGETRVEREALALKDHGFEVDVICLGSKEELSTEIISGINVYRLPIRRRWKPNLFEQFFEYLAFFVHVTFKLIGLHRNRHYQVIQVHNLPDWLVFACLIPKIMGARVILDLHDLMPEFFAAKFSNGMNSFAVKMIIWQEQLSCQFADQVITVTENWRETLIKRGQAPGKVRVVMNVADGHIFHQTDSGRPTHASGDGLQLLYHGNLTYRYGIDLAIRAVGIVKDRIPNIHLHIHGWGDYSQNLVELTNELELNDYVRFSTESLPTSALPEMIQQADICIVPYRTDIFTDGILPTKLMEYAALGTPVIAAHTETISRYFDDSMVQFFKPGDAQGLAQCLLDLFLNPLRLVQLSQCISEFNRRFAWSDISANYVHLVEQLGTGRKVQDK